MIVIDSIGKLGLVFAPNRSLFELLAGHPDAATALCAMAKQYKVEGDVVTSLVEARIKKTEGEAVQGGSASSRGCSPMRVTKDRARSHSPRRTAFPKRRTLD